MTVGPYTITFSQRNAANTAYRETLISGSNLLLVTDATGVLTGSSDISASKIVTNDLTASNNTSLGTTIIHGIARLYDVAYAYMGIIGDVTGSISGSQGVFTYLTASHISGSVDSSSYAGNATLFNGRSTATFASTGSNVFTGSQQISGSISASMGSFNSLFLNITSSAPSNIDDAGQFGEVRLDSNYLYVHMGSQWHRFSATLWR